MKNNYTKFNYLIFCLLVIGKSFAQQFTFQGKVYNNNAPVNSNGAIFQFSLLNAAPAWTETQNNIPIRNGYYAVVLGSVSPLPLDLFSNSQSRQLSIRYAGNLIDTVTIHAPFERDYTVAANVKDGVSWNEILGNPTLTDALTQKLSDILVPPGTIQAFGGDSSKVPVGWAICNGQTLNSSNTDAASGLLYSRLYAAIGTNWGGTGASSFRLPDLRGRFLRGQSSSGDTTDADRNARTAKFFGGNVGNRVGSYQLDAFQGHRHDISLGLLTGNAVYWGPANSVPRSDVPDNGATGMHGIGAKTDNLHGNPRISAESRPRNAAVHYMIKL